jgi:hypothetical protein
MSKPRSRSPKLSAHDQLATEMRKIASYENIKKRFNDEEPFASNLTDRASFALWVTFTMNLLHNTFCHSRKYKESNSDGHDKIRLFMPNFFSWLRNETTVRGKFSPRGAYDWVFRKVLAMARRHSVWNLVSVHGYSIDLDQMSADEWEQNMLTIANGFDPDNEYDTLNVFVCKQKDGTQNCFISSPQISKGLQKRFENNEETEIEVCLSIGGGNYQFYINSPRLCGFPFAERNEGPAKDLAARFCPDQDF